MNDLFTIKEIGLNTSNTIITRVIDVFLALATSAIFLMYYVLPLSVSKAIVEPTTGNLKDAAFYLVLSLAAFLISAIHVRNKMSRGQQPKFKYAVSPLMSDLLFAALIGFPLLSVVLETFGIRYDVAVQKDDYLEMSVAFVFLMAHNYYIKEFRDPIEVNQSS